MSISPELKEIYEMLGIPYGANVELLAEDDLHLYPLVAIRKFLKYKSPEKYPELLKLIGEICLHIKNRLAEKAVESMNGYEKEAIIYLFSFMGDEDVKILEKKKIIRAYKHPTEAIFYDALHRLRFARVVDFKRAYRGTEMRILNRPILEKYGILLPRSKSTEE